MTPFIVGSSVQLLVVGRPSADSSTVYRLLSTVYPSALPRPDGHRRICIEDPIAPRVNRLQVQARLDGIGKPLRGAGQDDEALTFGQGEKLVGLGEVDLAQVRQGRAEDESQAAARGRGVDAGG